jgi:CubicO group peptidase (beta-lactamase class C family)
MLRTALLLFFGLLALPGATPAGGQQLDAATRSAIDSIFAAHDGTAGPGCAVGVVRGGDLVYSRGYGMGNLDHGIPLTPRSVFYLASVSKQFAAAAVVLAEHQGFLSLDDPIQRHIPEFPDYGAPLTVRHLVHHTGGVRDYLTLMALAGRPLENVLSDGEMLDLITRQRELNFRPGSDFLYSNSGYVLLAEIVKRATGRSLRAYADEAMFRPLGMTSTHFHDDAGEVVANRVFSYSPGPDGTWRTQYLMNFDKVGDGGLYSSVEDLARWDAAFYEDRLGVPGFAERMYQRGVLDSGDTIVYAGGLTVDRRRGLTRVAHSGGLMAFRTLIARYPDHATTVITLCNAGHANPGRLSTAVEDRVLGSAFPEPAPVAGGAAQAPATAAGEAEGERVTPSVATLEAVAGSYRSEELDATWTLERDGDTLQLLHPSGPPRPLQPRGELVFAGPGGLVLTFGTTDGAVTGFTLEAGRVRNLGFERVP